MADVSHLLAAAGTSDPKAAADLHPLVYDELRKLAAVRLAAESAGQTLLPTVLVHQAYLRLVGDGPLRDWTRAGHLFAAAAEAVRRVLINCARDKHRLKRGGCGRVDLDALDDLVRVPDVDVLDLDDAFTRLAGINAPAAELVQLKFFAGLTLHEAAAALGVPPRSADRLWVFARA